MAKNIIPPEEVEELAPVDDAVVDVVPDVIEPVAGAPVLVKRALGVKEPIEFKFKVIGRAAGMILTLFKAVERPDADAQFERLTREGYYKDLQVVEASMKIEQPAQPKGAKKPAAKVEAAAPVKARAATTVSTAMAVKKPFKATNPPPPPSKKTAPVRAAAKPAAKPAPKPAPKAAAKPGKKKPAPAKKSGKGK